MRGIGIVDWRNVLHIEHRLCFQNSLRIATLYLLLIPTIRGVSNLDAVHVSQCLQEMVALIGILILVPISNPEASSLIRDVVKCRICSYKTSLFRRMMIGGLWCITAILFFELVLLWRNCQVEIVWNLIETLLIACILGFVGLLSVLVTRQPVIGYLVSIGVYLINMLHIIPKDSIFYLFCTDTSKNGNRSILVLIVISLIVAIWSHDK